jgi:hypothetical protein
VQPNLRRFLPFLIILFFLLVLLPSLLHKSSATGLTAKELSHETIGAMGLVDRAEAAYKAAHGRYSGHLSDLLELSHPLGKDLVDGVAVQLDVSTDGQAYFGEVGSNVITLVRSRQAGKTIAHGCTVVKSGSGVACPATTTTSTTTTTTTTATTAG